jgi:Asp-tRNA(Asn)/Glu-tRNA(Gln) amidotransferase C subunit
VKKLVSEEELQEVKKFAEEMRELIQYFSTVAKEVLKQMPQDVYVQKVCDNSIDDELIKGAKEGDFLFQCEKFHNIRYFTRLNRFQNPGEEKPGINVHVAGVVKFTMDCPRAGSSTCKLKDVGR